MSDDELNRLRKESLQKNMEGKPNETPEESWDSQPLPKSPPEPSGPQAWMQYGPGKPRQPPEPEPRPIGHGIKIDWGAALRETLERSRARDAAAAADADAARLAVRPIASTGSSGPPPPREPATGHQPTPHDDEHHPTTKAFDYLALGLILAPPGVIGLVYVEGGHVDVTRSIVLSLMMGVPGVVSLWAARKWRSWSASFIAAESKLWVKAVIIAVFMAIPTLLAPLVSVSDSNGVRPQGTATQAIVTPSGDLYGSYEGRPLAFWWKGADLGAQQPTATSPAKINFLSIRGANLGASEVQLKAAHLVSRIDGTRLRLKISGLPNEYIFVDEAGPVPAAADFQLRADFNENKAPLTEEEFLRTWASFYVLITRDGPDIVHDFTKAEILAQLDQIHHERRPHVSRRQP